MGATEARPNASPNALAVPFFLQDYNNSYCYNKANIHTVREVHTV